MTKWCDGKGYGLFLNEDGCIEFRINDQVITTGAPVRDHAWHFIAASFDAATGEATLYHEPQVVYALDPEIAPVTKKLSTKLAYVKGTPTVIAGYCGTITDLSQAKASVPPRNSDQGALQRQDRQPADFQPRIVEARDRDHEAGRPARTVRTAKLRSDRKAV